MVPQPSITTLMFLFFWELPIFEGAVSRRNYGAPGRTRTADHLVRSQVLYPTELRARGGAVYFAKRMSVIAGL